MSSPKIRQILLIFYQLNDKNIKQPFELLEGKISLGKLQLKSTPHRLRFFLITSSSALSWTKHDIQRSKVNPRTVGQKQIFDVAI